MTPSQHLHTIELFSSFKPVVKKHFTLNCTDEKFKLFCNSILKIKQKSIKLHKKTQSAKKRTMLIEKLCSTTIRLVLKRGLLVSKQWLFLATSQQFIYQIPEISCVVDVSGKHVRGCSIVRNVMGGALGFFIRKMEHCRRFSYNYYGLLPSS